MRAMVLKCPLEHAGEALGDPRAGRFTGAAVIATGGGGAAPDG